MGHLFEHTEQIIMMILICARWWWRTWRHRQFWIPVQFNENPNFNLKLHWNSHEECKIIWEFQTFEVGPHFSNRLGDILDVLTAHYWQNWKNVFLSYYCHEIYRVEAVGLQNYNYSWKITIFLNMWNLGQFLEKLIFCQ